MAGEVLVGCGLDLGGRERDLDPLVVDVAVAGHSHDDELAGTVEVPEGEHDILEGVRGGEPAVQVGVAVVDEGGDGRRVRRVEDHRRRLSLDGDRFRRNGREGLHVGRVAARAAHERVLTDRRRVQEFLGPRASHRTGVGLHDHVVETEPLEDALVGIALRHVGRIEALVGRIERIGVLHRELTAAQQTGARTRLVAVFVLDLVDRQGEVLVRRVQVLHQEGEGLFVRRRQQVVGVLAILQPEDPVAVLLPSTGRLVRLPRHERREVHLLGPRRGHLLADDALEAVLHPEPERQPGEDARSLPADVPGADEQPVTGDLGIRGIFSECAEEQVRQTGDHDRQVYGPRRRGIALDR